MAKVQTGYYQKWRDASIRASYSADQTLDEVIEYVGVDTTSAVVEIELPDATSSEITNGKTVWIYDEGGNAGVNAIKLIPNASDSTTIEGAVEVYIEDEQGIIILELVESTWLIQAVSGGNTRYGGFYLDENATVTTISALDTYTQIAGTAVALPTNKFSLTGTNPNILTYQGNEATDNLVNVGAAIARDLGANPLDYRMALFKNGTEVTGANSMVSVTTREIGIAFNTIIPLAKNDTLECRIKNESTANNIVVASLSITVIEL